MRRWLLIAAVAAGPASASAQEPFYLPPGDLLPDSGQGVPEETVFVPGMRYPVESGPSYPNSQVYMNGGLNGPGGSQCDAVNYSYPWRDNYCEIRSWDMPLCPAGTGHQGQDIRAPTCEKDKYWIVAGQAGQVTNVGSYSVYVTSPNGQRLDYLHGSVNTLAVVNGQQVERGQNIVKLSNNMGDTPTSIHLHFNVKQDVGGVGFVYVSPYMSLVRAYEELMGLGNKPPDGVFDQSACETLYGWAQDPDAPDEAVTVALFFDGPKGDPAATGVEVTADLHRDDLCMTLGSCNHGFELDVPLSLRDGQPHAVHVYALDTGGGAQVELQLSPGQLQCEPPPLPAGVRRWVTSPESLAAWQFSPFWQMIRASDEQLLALAQDRDLVPAPVLMASDAEPGKVWLVDEGWRRHVPNPEAAAAWGFDLGAAAIWPAADVQALIEGTPLRPAPVLAQGTGPEVWLIDDRQCGPGGPPDPDCGLPAGSTGASEGSEGGPGPGSGSGLSGAPGVPTGGAGEGQGASESEGPDSALPPGFGSEDEGCGCKQSGQDFWLAGLIGPGIFARRRRRRVAPCERR
jgi:murein DD-endopeptidase MepM/ murein hydrolase activator NlpD